MYAFGGYELITIPAGEAKSPRKGVPQALLATIGIVSALYLIVQVIAAGTLSDLAGSDAPLADAAATFIGPATGIAIALAGLVSIGGANAGTMLAGPRLFYALAEKKQFPQFFARLHPQFRTPHVSIFVYFLISLFLALTGSFMQLAAVSAVARLAFYTTTCASVPILRRRGPAQPEKTFQIKGGSLIPILGTIVSIAIIAGSDSHSLTAGVLAFAVGALFYIPLAMRRRNRD
jgi:amino acid transporter